MTSINPATGVLISEYSPLTPAELEARLQEARIAFHKWQRTSFNRRATLMRCVADQLSRTKSESAALITNEMGKPVTESLAEIEKCARVCEFYADHAEQFLTPRHVETDASRSFISFDPLGPVLAVMPWSFPFWQVFRFAVPTIMAGNVVLLKHASNVSGCALAMERIFRSAGFPAGVLTTLLIESAQVQDVLASPIVQAVTFTGSAETGREVAAAAGEHLKKCVLELGGSDPFIVLEDVDIGTAARQAVKSRIVNSGQSCIAAKRFIVEQPIAEAFLDAMRHEMNSLQIGDPNERATQVGPMARTDLRDALHDQVQRSIASGAVLICGGRPLDRTGFFYAPTILAEVQPGNPAFVEETFGPVAAVTAARDVEAAVGLANESGYGLGASIWSRDTERAIELAGRIESGAVFINEVTKSDPRVPFGGIRNSGYGREPGEHGIREFVNTKTVWAA